MAYDKQIWDTNSIFNPTRMNHIENGIESASPKISEFNVTIGAGTGSEPFTYRGFASLPSGVTIDRVTGLLVIGGFGVVCWDSTNSRLRIASSTDTTLRIRVVYN